MRKDKEGIEPILLFHKDFKLGFIILFHLELELNFHLIWWYQKELRTILNH